VPAGEALLFAAARIDHLERTIRPALAAGTWVVCDRFADSTRAYQGGRNALDEDFVLGLERLVVGATRPDLTLIIDLPVALGLARAARRRDADVLADRFEREALAFHQGVRKAFLAIAAAEPERCVLVDGTQSAESIAETIFDIVVARFGLDTSRHKELEA
jgi:dTMP kinase